MLLKKANNVLILPTENLSHIVLKLVKSAKVKIIQATHIDTRYM